MCSAAPKATTASTATAASTRCGATAATTTSTAAPNPTTCSAARATTSSRIRSATTCCAATRATTSSPPPAAPTCCSATRARTTSSSARTPREVFGGTGDDFILGGDGKDFLLGNEGNDWIEGGAGFDTIAGENSELFFNSPIIGHDVAFGQGDETDYDVESGDDIMGSGPSVFRYEGMFGFDWGIGKGDTAGVRFDLQIPIFTTIPTDVLRDRFDQVEALSGWKFDDILDGDDRGHKGGGSSAPDSVPTELFADHLLTQEGINRIAGFNAWFGGTSTAQWMAPTRAARCSAAPRRCRAPRRYRPSATATS